MNEEDFSPSWDFRDCRLENNGLIPKKCGYNKTFRYKVPLNSHGVDGGMIDWCTDNCKHSWGWHFEPTDQKLDGYEEDTHWNEDRAVVSFSNKKEAFPFKLKAM